MPKLVVLWKLVSLTFFIYLQNVPVFVVDVSNWRKSSVIFDWDQNPFWWRFNFSLQQLDVIVAFEFSCQCKWGHIFDFQKFCLLSHNFEIIPAHHGIFFSAWMYVITVLWWWRMFWFHLKIILPIVGFLSALFLICPYKLSC